jgi:hypothetical protein
MKYFHGNNKKHSYFEGWYFKHTKKDALFAFIPGMNVDESGRKDAFIQVISTEGSYNIKYDFAESRFNTDKLFIKIGENEFSEKGIKLNIASEELVCSGEILYSSLTQLENDIMGPFRFVPFMECNHGVISVRHKATGCLNYQGKQIAFDNNSGYIEKDWGTSFPEKYFWLQCNDFVQSDLGIMVSIAEIPFLRSKFTGCICSIHYNGKQYRLATYHKVKIEKLSKSEVVLRQGKFLLEIIIQPFTEHLLLAPMKGSMKRNIKETSLGTASFRFLEQNEVVFHEISNNVSYEWVDYTP